MNNFLTIIAWVFGLLALARFLACGHAAYTATRLVVQNAYYSAAGKAFLVLVVCAAWLIAKP